MLLNVDLMGLTPILLEHLDAWKDFMLHSTDRTFMGRCLERYERLWLPLLREGDDDLEPPDDVHWMWYLHLLSPCDYVVYCKKRFACVLPHKFKRSKIELQASKSRSKQVWNMIHPDEPFELNVQQLSDASHSSNSLSSKLDYFLTTANNERDFVYRCDLPHFRDQAFQLSAVHRYKQYLFLKQQCPHWTPCRIPTDLELIWRVHLLHPSHYISDILRIVDDNKKQTDFTTYSLHPKLFHPLKPFYPDLVHDNQFWSYFFPDDEFQFHANGSINRQPSSYEATRNTLKHFSCSNSERETPDECLMRFDGLSITDLWSRRKNIKVVASLLGSNSFQQHKIFQFKDEAEWSFKSSNKKLLKFEKKKYFGECKFVRTENKGIEVDVYVCGRIFSRYKLVTKKSFDPLYHLSTCPDHQNATHHQSTMRVSQEVSMPKVTYTDPNITINYVLQFPDKKPYNFILDRNAAESKPLPAHLDGFLLNVLAWRVAINDPLEHHKFMVARHSLKCRDHGLAFGVEVVRDDQHNLNAVLVFHNNVDLVAVAFTIDAGFLPTSLQVMETCPLTYDSEKGDVAMMIQKADGQDYIIVASFKEDNKKEGRTIIFTTYSMANRRCQRLEVKADEIQVINNSTTNIDLPSGRISVKDQLKLVPDHLAWAFSVGCLFLSMQSWSGFEEEGRQDGISSIFSGSVRSLNTRVSDGGTEDSISGDKTRSKERLSVMKMRKNRRQIKRRKMSASFTFLLACGLRLDSVCGSLNRHSGKFLPTLSSNPSINSSNTFVQI